MQLVALEEPGSIAPLQVGHVEVEVFLRLAVELVEVGACIAIVERVFGQLFALV